MNEFRIDWSESIQLDYGYESVNEEICVRCWEIFFWYFRFKDQLVLKAFTIKKMQFS